MSDLQDEGVDESDGKTEDAVVLTKTDIEVARKIEENSGHSRSLSIESSGSESSLQSSSSSSSGKSIPTRIGRSGVAVTFGITASDKLTPVDNLSGWKMTWLSKTYNKVVGLTGLTRRGDFRVRFIPYFFFVQEIDTLSRRISSIRNTFRCTSAMRSTRALGSMASTSSSSACGNELCSSALLVLMRA